MKIKSTISAKIFFRKTFKVVKYHSLFCKINTCLQKTIACISLRKDTQYSLIGTLIFSANINISLGVAFAVLFLCHFQKLQLLVIKRFEFFFFFFLYCTSTFTCLRFLKSYFKLEILTFSSEIKVRTCSFGKKNESHVQSLLVLRSQSQQYKQSRVCSSMLKVNKKDNRMISLTSVWSLAC